MQSYVLSILLTICSVDNSVSLDNMFSVIGERYLLINMALSTIWFRKARLEIRLKGPA